MQRTIIGNFKLSVLWGVLLLLPLHLIPNMKYGEKKVEVGRGGADVEVVIVR